MKRIAVWIVGLAVAQAHAQREPVKSLLQTIDIETQRVELIASFDYLIEAPNWTHDGYLIYNSGGQLYKIKAGPGAEPSPIVSGYATACNNDHVPSFDGKTMAVSHATREDRKSRIYTFPIEGGTPRLITPLGPSYLHGWSPDGRWLAYCAERNGEYDVYVIPSEGGEEVRLTHSEGLDDGPEYSPDGRYIWFNSVRTGLMQLWRMKADGREQTQMTFDTDRNSWFPHLSPDGKWVVYLSYRKGDLLPHEHLPFKQVDLRLLPVSGGEPQVLLTLFGGQGSLNVNSWSPDSRKVAFVSYER